MGRGWEGDLEGGKEIWREGERKIETDRKLD